MKSISNPVNLSSSSQRQRGCWLQRSELPRSVACAPFYHQKMQQGVALPADMSEPLTISVGLFPWNGPQCSSPPACQS